MTIRSEQAPSTYLGGTSQVATLTRRLVLAQLKQITFGRIIVRDPLGTVILGENNPQSLEAHLVIDDLEFYLRIANRGSIGAAESYMVSQWKADSLTTLIRIFVRNKSVLDAMDGGIRALVAKPFLQFFHWLHRNTKYGSKKNIEAHYDLGNDFFSLFLDKTMSYSSGIFTDEKATLEQASIEKIDRCCRKLGLKPGHLLLEIGTGWGALAIHAAKNYGCQVITTTISEEQYALACQRVHEAGLDHKITVLKEDYRNLTGKFDRIVSVEMLEAVGLKFHEDYYQKCSSLLKEDGMMVLQSITIADQNFKYYSKNVDFIQRYIFPGGALPSVTQLCETITNASDLRVFHLEDFSEHYARTLRAWREAYFARKDQVAAQGFSQSFQKMWEFYLCYCEGAFMERATGVIQVILQKPLCRDQNYINALNEGEKA